MSLRWSDRTRTPPRTGGSKGEDSTMALNNYRVGAIVAVSDMELARDFYEK